MKALTPASRYKALLQSLIGLGQPFMTAAHIRPHPGAEKREYNVFYCMNLDHDAEKLVMRAYAVQTPPTAGENTPYLVTVDPEMDFIHHGDFWVGHPGKIFVDYVAANDKNRLNLSWAAAYDRKTVMNQFHINRRECLFRFEINVAMLDAFAIGESAAAAAEVLPQFARSSASLGISTGDTVLDTPRAGATPTLGNTNPA